MYGVLQIPEFTRHTGLGKGADVEICPQAAGLLE